MLSPFLHQKHEDFWFLLYFLCPFLLTQACMVDTERFQVHVESLTTVGRQRCEQMASQSGRIVKALSFAYVLDSMSVNISTTVCREA